jgi:uncharacterized protein (TIGR03435 family)
VFQLRAALVGAILLASIVAAQPPEQRAFEVASIKLVATEAQGPLPKPTVCGLGAGGRFQAFGWVRYFIACAYQTGFGKIDDFILGGPSWMEGEYYEINATLATDAAPLTQTDGFAALRALLADRFKLSLHRETRESPMYALVTAKHGGPGLRPADASCVDARCARDTIGPSSIRSRAITLAQLAKLRSSRTGRRVEDRTGLAGVYDVNLEWKPTRTAPPSADAGRPDFLPADPAPSPIFGALEEQLGLRLQPITGTSDVIVIDHVERPSPN